MPKASNKPLYRPLLSGWAEISIPYKLNDRGDYENNYETEDEFVKMISYYWNPVTKETTWFRPVDKDAKVHTTPQKIFTSKFARRHNPKPEGPMPYDIDMLLTSKVTRKGGNRKKSKKQRKSKRGRKSRNFRKLTTGKNQR